VKLKPIAGAPLEGWVQATRLNLGCLRLALIDRHRDVFEAACAMGFDPSNWMARTVEAEIGALITTLELYEQAVRCTPDLEDIDF